MKRLLWALAAILLAAHVLQAQVPLRDDFEGGLNAWQVTGSWGLSGARSASPTHAITDSPGAFYTNNTSSAMTLVNSVSLAGTTRPALGFQQAYLLEAAYDFGYVEVSTNGGTTWLAPALGTFTGTKSEFTREQLDLSAYAGVPGFRVRFHLVTDGSVVMDGWYVDDVILGEAPAPVTLTATQTNRNSVQFSWSPVAATDFAAYRIYRSLTAGVDWHTARMVSEITSNSVSTGADLTASPKTKYYYRLAVVNTNGLLTLGSEISVTTLPGMDYPFVDNGEGGSATWIPDAPWALSAEDAVSPAHAWSDSPGMNYANGIGSQSLLLAAPLYLAGKAVVPVLSFNYKTDLGSGDSANVEISINNGADWTSLASFAGSTAGDWQRGRISLVAYTNAAILVRFRLTSDAAATSADGWHLDDISVAEAPNGVPAPVLDNVTSHTIRLSWAATTNVLFAHYALFRSTVPGVGINSTPIAVLSNPATTTFTDTNLALDTVYYYRVYAVSPFGAFSPDSLLESSARTLNNPSPFGDGFETGLVNWNLTGSWGRITNDTHSGTFALADSPQGNYGNSVDSYALTAVNLSGTSWPVLRFWDRVRLGSGDWGRMEVSPDGSTWTAVYGVSEYQVRGEWGEQSIDLSPWKGQSNLRIRMHLWTDASGTEDGWAVDDLTLAEHVPVAVGYPFYESFEQGLSNWLHAGWVVETNGPYAGGHAVHDTVPVRIAPDTTLWLTLAGEVNLTNAVEPQLTFWVRGHLWHYSGLRFQVSTDGGLTWPELGAVNLDTGFDQGWTRKQVALTSYTNRTVRVRFQAWSYNGSAPDEDLVLDKITIEDAPPPVVLETATPHLKSVDLQWSVAALGAMFQRNEVYRASHANVTLADTLVGVFTNASVISLADTGLSIGATYYYRVFTVDRNDTYTASNERSATTVPLTFPVTDGLENLNQWVTTGSWGITPTSPHAGSGALADSPVGDYGNSVDSYALTAVNLSGTSWPVLRFWDRVRLGSGDWGRMEVSPDGSTWTAVYGVSEYQVRGEWGEQSIDLSPWKGQSNLRIRMHLWTDASGTEDGWAVDDLTLAEHVPVAVGYPFYESFEQGLSNWLHAGWVVETNGPYAGGHAVHDTVPVRIAPDTTLWLTLAGEVNLTNAVEPQLTFWVRGHLWHYSGLRFQVSTDGGLTWPELGAVNLDTGFDQGWTRKQVALTSYTNRTVRVRFQAWSYNGSAPDEDLVLDKITIEDAPPPVVLETATPHLKSVDLQWSVAALGAMFQRNEVYRASHANVTLADTLVGVFTNASVISLADTGLSIGATYYYRVFTVDRNDTYTASNERSATTVPLTFPVTDGLENLNQWVTTGSWGITPTSPHAGSGALADSPVGDYGNSVDSYALTAVNLSGTSWPVLRFWDRVRLGSGDWGRMEVSPDGSTWTAVYGVSEYQVRGEWGEQSIDLSPWKGQSNLRIRMHLWTDASGTEDGWAVDDLTLAEHVPVAVGYPFYESFEQGLSNWLHAGWVVETNGPYAGGHAVHDTVPVRIAPDTTLWLTLAGEVNLTNAVEPQLTFWVRGHLWHYSGLRFQVSTDGGLTWPELGAVNLDTGFDQGWTRKQVALTSYTNRTVRVRFQAWSYNGSAPDEDLVLDKITIEDAPPPVVLNPIDEVSVSTLRLTWTPTGLVNFREYRIYRSESSSVTEASILVASFTNQAVMAFVDTGLMARKKYYYRIFLYNNSDTSTGGNQASAMTGGVTVPWSDNFETNAVGWTFTGSWTNWPGGGRNGSMGLLDSPGDYANSADSWAQFAVNLSGTTWPVLRFWDRHALADNDWGRLEISSDAGANWRPVYGVSSTRTNWAEQSIDLSPWRNQSQVWFRFHLFTDGSVPNDGWSVDDVGLAEHVPVAVGYPFYENFENGLTNWLHAGWITDTNAPYGGGYAVHDTVPLRIAPDTTLWLTLAGELNLTNAVDPQLTFWVRGYLWHYSGLRFQVSTDGGLTWAELAAVNLDTGFNADWTRKQVALTSYTNQTVRVRFQTWSYNGSAPDEDIFLDNIGIGEFAPSAPSLHSPRDQGIVGVLRPTLIVNNAIDYQGDPVSYRFEVYADAGLSNLVAQVPVMAAGWNTTAWQVDVNLLDHAQYWWRCLASSGPNISPWMPATSFYINHTNRAPFAVVIPSGWLTLSNTDGVLTWYPTTDPDPGDYVLAYQVQVDDDPDFGSPVIDQGDVQLALPEELTSWLSVSLPLKEFVGADHLQAGHRYYWRVRAVDSYYTLSEWPAGEHWFQFGATVTDPLRLTALSSPDAAGRMTLEWSVTGSRVYVEFKPSLEGLNWQTIAGPLSAHSFTITNSATMPTGFLRLRQE